MATNRFAAPLAGLALLLFIAAGCSDKPKDRAIKTVPVTGKVMMGSKPLAGATVTFTPRGATRGTGGFGVTDAEGKFEANVTPDTKGMEPGEYAVTFTKWAQKDGSPIPEGKTAADVMAVQIIPQAYSDPTLESQLNVVTVKPEGGSFDFLLPEKK